MFRTKNACSILTKVFKQQHRRHSELSKLTLTSLLAIFSLKMCLQDVKVPATAGCMVDGIMDQAMYNHVGYSMKYYTLCLNENYVLSFFF